jgi:MoaA/NifB/PqqE/SkfB family radical SAM enzyme
VSNRLALLRGLLHGEAVYAGPAWVALDVTRRCNNVCLGCFFHCVQDREPSPGDHEVQELQWELVERLCCELPSLGTPEVILVGEGEPLLHPKLPDYIGALKSSGLRVQSFTNGLLLQEVAERIVASGLDELNITFWAANHREHEAWHPGLDPANLERRISGVRDLVRARRRTGSTSPAVNLQMPLQRNTLGNLQERLSIALEAGCDRVTLGFFRDTGGRFEHLVVKPEDVAAAEPELLAMARRLEEAGIGHNLKRYLSHARRGADAWRSLPCYAGFFTSYVKVDGTVLPCGPCGLIMGRLMEESFREIWHGRRYLEFRRTAVARNGLRGLEEDCNCSNCCLVQDNLRVHRIFRWLRPFTGRPRPKHDGLEVSG